MSYILNIETATRIALLLWQRRKIFYKEIAEEGYSTPERLHVY
jgi:tRNA threonylcarbamoyladenosine biosynthesis protein TsaB